MTDLKRPVRRKTLRSQWGDDNGKKLVVMLEPGDIVAIKTERCRSWHRIAIHTLFWQLCQRDAEEQRKHRKVKR